MLAYSLLVAYRSVGLFVIKENEIQTIEKLISEHNHIMHTPSVAYFLFKHNKQLYYTGLSESFIWSAYRRPPSEFLFPYTNKVTKIHTDYVQRIAAAIRNKKFSNYKL